MDNLTNVTHTSSSISSPGDTERNAVTRKLSLWETLTTVHTNPINNKCTTLPVFALNNPYSRSFHLSWLGFWVAFLSWFAFSPLVPEAVRADLKLTQQQVGNSNIISLCATLIVRVIIGPLVDRYGPRKVMAAILAIGAIPSGLAGTVTTVEGLYIVRFFIGILGGTFVPCQAWTTAFYDTSVVGSANALAAGWGNSGGGFTFLIMVALYDRLRADGLSQHSAWRAAFAIVPVPILLLISVLTLVFGTDHPNGRWADRHRSPAGELSTEDPQNSPTFDIDEKEKDAVTVVVTETSADFDADPSAKPIKENQVFSLQIAQQVVSSPLTWLPALAYMTTFGYELALDANLANVLFEMYNPTDSSFGQTKAGYIASVFGLLNIFSRPLGGYLGDLAYRKGGVRAKKYLVLASGVLQGAMSLALGLYIDQTAHPSLAAFIVIMIILALVDEIGNGANFSLVPHCNPGSNGFMTGIVGAMGNLGGIWFALIFRFQPYPLGKAFWIAGVICMAVNMLLWGIRV